MDYNNDNENNEYSNESENRANSYNNSRDNLNEGGESNRFEQNETEQHNAAHAESTQSDEQRPDRENEIDQRRREEDKEKAYLYQGSSYYEAGQRRPEKRKKRFSGFSLIAAMIVFTLLGTSLGVYGAYNVLPGTSLFENSKLGKLIGENSGGVEKVFTPALASEGLTIPVIVRKVQPAVVTVAVKVQSQGNIFNPQAGYSENIGTGFILNEEGLIATNYHVVQGGEDVTVTLYTGDEVSAKVVNFDAANDLAVLQMDEKVKVPGVVELGDSENLLVGESVIAIGNPVSKDFAGTVTAGIISATERKVQVANTEYSYIQTDAAINGGNSGGPLINAKGQVIGINSAKISSESVEGIGFAIPINVLINGLDVLSRAQLIIGIAGREVNETMATQTKMPVGVLVVEVQKDTPAYLSALIVGDVITEFDGKKVSSVKEINDIKNTKTSGDEVLLKIFRDGVYLDLKLTLREK